MEITSHSKPTPIPSLPSSKQVPLQEAIKTQMIAELLSRSADYDPCLNALTLKEWLYRTFSLLTREKDFPIKDDALAECQLIKILTKKINQHTLFEKIFGKNTQNCSIQNRLVCVFTLAKQHEYFDRELNSFLTPNAGVPAAYRAALDRVKQSCKCFEQDILGNESLYEPYELATRLYESPDFHPSFTKYTLDEWLLHTLLKLLEAKDFPLPQHLAILRLQEILVKRVKEHHSFSDIFGPNAKKCSINKNLISIFNLATHHSYWAVKIDNLLSFIETTDTPSSLINAKNPLETYHFGIILIIENFDAQLTAINKILKDVDIPFNFCEFVFFKTQDKTCDPVLAQQLVPKLGALRNFYEMNFSKTLKDIKDLQPLPLSSLQYTTSFMKLTQSILETLPLMDRLIGGVNNTIEQIQNILFLPKNQKDAILKKLHKDLLPSLRPFPQEKCEDKDQDVIQIVEMLNKIFENEQYLKHAKTTFSKTTQTQDLLRGIGSSILEWMCKRIQFHLQKNSQSSDETGKNWENPNKKSHF